jgi:hypothetical protein
MSAHAQLDNPMIPETEVASVQVDNNGTMFQEDASALEEEL